MEHHPVSARLKPSSNLQEGLERCNELKEHFAAPLMGNSEDDVSPSSTQALSFALARSMNEIERLQQELEMEQFRSAVMREGHAKELAMQQKMEAIKINTMTEVHSLEISNIQEIATRQIEFHQRENRSILEHSKCVVEQTEALNDLRVAAAEARATSAVGWGVREHHH